MVGKLSGHLVVILCIALLIGALLLLGSLMGPPPSQNDIMLITPPYQLA
jgi:hypothetical protein